MSKISVAEAVVRVFPGNALTVAPLNSSPNGFRTRVCRRAATHMAAELRMGDQGLFSRARTPPRSPAFPRLELVQARQTRQGWYTWSPSWTGQRIH